MRLHTTPARVALISLVTLSLGCAVTQPVRVLGKGERRWISSIGGPLLPGHVPSKVIPYTNVGMMWGRSDNLTLSANAHLFAAAFGVAGMDVGAARRLHTQSGLTPEITTQAQLYLFAGAAGVRAYPNFVGTASYNAGPRTLLYGGTALTVRPSGGKALLASPLMGVQRDVGKRFALQLEGKWMVANIDMHSGLFEGESTISGHGGIGVQFGVQVKR